MPSDYEIVKQALEILQQLGYEVNYVLAFSTEECLAYVHKDRWSS